MAEHGGKTSEALAPGRIELHEAQPWPFRKPSEKSEHGETIRRVNEMHSKHGIMIVLLYNDFIPICESMYVLNPTIGKLNLSLSFALLQLAISHKEMNWLFAFVYHQ